MVLFKGVEKMFRVMILRNHETRKTGGKALWIAALLAALLVAGCAGIKPYEPRDHREEGPQKGLFTGSEGEFVIFRKVDESETGSEAGKKSNETADGEQQKLSSEEKKAKNKSDEQQP
jgi:hypothetical protein